MSKTPPLRIASSSDQRFVQASHRRLLRRKRLRLFAWLAFLALVGAFYYLAGHQLAARLWARLRRGGEEWKAGTTRTFRHISGRESAGGQRP